MALFVLLVFMGTDVFSTSSSLHLKPFYCPVNRNGVHWFPKCPGQQLAGEIKVFSPVIWNPGLVFDELLTCSYCKANKMI